jgi:serine/threonine protein kinase
MSELGELMRMSFLRYIPKAMLLNWTQIDKGSFGKIFRCSCAGTDVAVKEIGRDGSNSALKTRMRELFLELRVLVMVDHPRVVQFLGTAMDFPKSGGQDPSVDMVFAMCHGGSVHRALFGNDGGPQGGRTPKLGLRPERKVQIAAQVAAGLTYLHSKRIIHRCATRPAVARSRASRRRAARARLRVAVVG